MNERIKYIRKSCGLSQAAFGASIGITDGAVSKLESGTNTPSDQTCKLICQVYHVNYIWLTTGEGDVFEIETAEDMVERLMAGESPLAISIMRAFAGLPVDEWRRLRDMIDRVKKEGLQ